MAKPTANVNQFKRWCRDNWRLALAVCTAQAAAEGMREEVNRYIQPIFDRFNFVCEGKAAQRADERAAERGSAQEKWVGRPCATPDSQEFVMLHGADESEEIQAKLRSFYDEVDAEHRRRGHTDLPKDHCPALRLQGIHTQAENALIESAEPLFGITEVYGENRKKYLELLLGACIKTMGEYQEECGRETAHCSTEPSPLDPNRLRCANCCIEVKKAA